MANSSINPSEVSPGLSEKYELQKELGQGAYGTVFKAVQRTTGQAVAIKVQRLDPTQEGDLQAARLARFERETKLCAMLNHPHIVRIFDKGQSGDYLFIVFEFVPGETLTQVLARRGPLPVHEAVALMGQVLDALDGAHAQGIVHRDLKPDNIMVVSSGAEQYVKVLDFGVGAFVVQTMNDGAALTRSQEIMGTPSYSAPEQLRGEPATAKSDLYAWGLVFLECLTGRRIMDGATMAQVFHRQLSAREIPLPPALATHPLGDIVRRALAKAPRERANDARRLWMELRRARTVDLVGPIDIEGAPRSSRPAPETGPSYSYPSSEQRQATVFCCSLNVLPIGAHSPDIETLDAIQRDQLGLCADIATRFGGYIAGTLGNRIIAVFGIPRAGDGDARRAGRAALELASRIESRRPILSSQRGIDLELRIGIHTDIVIVDADGAPSGPALNVAARLESLAAPGSTLVSEVTRDLLHGHLVFQPADPSALRAGSALIKVYSLISERMDDALHALRGADPGLELVGRESEFETLLDHWASAQTGSGRVVLLTGEAGVGKSRLVHEIRLKALQTGAFSIDGQCLPEDGNTALHPVTTMIRQYFELDGEARDSGLLRLEQSIAGCGLDPRESMPVFCTWLSLDEEFQRYPPIQLSGERQRELLLDALVKLLCSVGGGRARIIVLEDLQWSDPTTRELIARACQLASRYQCLTLLTARPEFAPEAEALHVIRVHKLERPAVERLIAMSSAGLPLTPEIVSDIVERTDGVPLFVEQLTRSMSESGGSRMGPGRAATGTVPAGLRDLLNSRLDRLGRAKETAQLAAAIGREFDFELLRAVSMRDQESLQGDLDVLVDAELVRRQLQSTGARYVFRHALIREAAWESLLSSRRRTVHRNIAETLEARHAAPVASEPARLAWHYELAGIADRAIDYHLKASQQAARTSAYREAIGHLQAGIGLLPEVSDARDRNSREIDLRNALGAALVATQGFATDAVVETFTRSRDLLQMGTPTAVQNFTTLKGLWTFHNARANYQVATEMSERLLELAVSREDPEFLLSAHQCACQTALLLGRFSATVHHAGRCDHYFDPERQQDQVTRYGVDPWLSALAHECVAEVLLGNVTRARSRLEVGLAAAARLGSPNHEAALLAQGAALEIFLCSCGSDPRASLGRCVELATRAVEIGQRFGLRYPESYGRLIVAMVQALRGDAESLRQLQQAIEMWRFAGIEASLSWHFSFLAQGQLACSSFDAALSSARAALQHADRAGEGYGASEGHRVVGWVLGDPNNPRRDQDQAVAAYQAALQIARQQEARWLELRAAYTFAKQMPDAEGGLARDALESALTWFREHREGFDTPLVPACCELLGIGAR